MRGERTFKGNIKLVMSEHEAQQLWKIMAKTHLARFDLPANQQQYEESEPVAFEVCNALGDAGLTYKGIV